MAKHLKNTNSCFLQLVTGVGILLMLLSANNSRAQTLPETEAEPQPFLRKPMEMFSQKVTSTIKKLVVIVKFDSERNLANDTSSLYFFDKEGFKTKEVRFENKKPGYSQYFKYAGQNLVEWGEAENPTTKSRFVVVNRFDKNDNKILSEGFTIAKGDTISRNRQRFEYDEKNRLVKKTIFTNGLPTYVDNYSYNQTHLVNHFIYLNPSNKNIYQRVDYSYNAENLLNKKEELYVNDTLVKAFSYHYYTYQKSNLIDEKYSSGLLGNEETKVHYEYNKNGQVSTIKILKDSLYKNVAFQYEKERVKNVLVTTNAWNGLHREFYIPLSSLSPLTKMPITYEEEYLYDKKENLIEKNLILNGKMVKKLEYDIEYY